LYQPAIAFALSSSTETLQSAIPWITFLRERGYAVTAFLPLRQPSGIFREARDATQIVFTEVALADATPSEILNAAESALMTPKS
jgi:hypothetical protein